MKKDKTNHTVYKKIIAGFALIIALFILAGSVSFIGIHALGNLTSTIYKHPLEVSNASLRANMGVVRMHRTMKDIVLADDAVALENFIVQVTNEEAIVIQNLDIIRNKILGFEGQDLERETRLLFINWKTIRDEVITLTKEGGKKRAAQITTGKGAYHVSLLEEKMLALSSYARNKADSFFNESSKVQKRVTLSTGIFMGAGVLLSLLIASITTRQIIKYIHQGKESERALLSEQKFTQNAIDAQWDTFFIFEIETGKATHWNRRFQEISGYSAEEISSLKAPDAYYSEEDLKKAADIIEEVLAVGTGNIELTLLCKDGRKIPTEYMSSIINDEDGNPKHIISVGRDVSKRKLAEEEREKLITNLQKAVDEIKTLKGIIPICMHCKEIRDDDGYWNKLGKYITEHSEAQFSHSICDKCLKEHYSDYTK